MSRHLADHQPTPGHSGIAAFLRLARNRAELVWKSAWQRPPERSAQSRRLMEFIRIDRQRPGRG